MTQFASHHHRRASKGPEGPRWGPQGPKGIRRNWRIVGDNMQFKRTKFNRKQQTVCHIVIVGPQKGPQGPSGARLHGPNNACRNLWNKGAKIERMKPTLIREWQVTSHRVEFCSLKLHVISHDSSVLTGFFGVLRAPFESFGPFEALRWWCDANYVTLHSITCISVAWI